MPRLCVKFEKKKTLLSNLTQVAKALDRPAIYILKYFSIEIGAQIVEDKKDDRFFINGFHDAQKLQELLNFFIQTYVLCTTCENPETQLLVENKKISQKCKACGYQTFLKNQHKLNNFIIQYISRAN